MILKRLSRRYGTVISPSSACFATSAIFPRIFDTQLVSSSGEWGQSTFWRTYNPLLGPQNAISVPGQFSVSFYPIGWFSFWVFALIKWESFSLFEYFLYFIFIKSSHKVEGNWKLTWDRDCILRSEERIIIAPKCGLTSFSWRRHQLRNENSRKNGGLWEQRTRRWDYSYL